MRVDDYLPHQRDIASREQGKDDRARHQHLPLLSKHSWEQKSTYRCAWTHTQTQTQTQYLCETLLKFKKKSKLNLQLAEVLRGFLSSKPSEMETTQHGEKCDSRGKAQTINTSGGGAPPITEN